MNPIRTSANTVRGRIAAALLTSSVPDALGDIVLRPHQRDAIARLHDTLSELRVALLADDVGLGKTFVALAVACRYERIRVIAPAALLPMWRQAVLRAQSRGVTVESLQRYSRGAPQWALERETSGTGSPPSTLVIIDEAHHLRTPTTRRYRAVSDMVAGHDLLLLSATPLHNTPRDLQSLLGLALGAQAKRLTPALLARVVVRRTQQDARPSVRELPPHVVPHDRAILDAILTLPAPLPAHDGAVAGALIRLGLLRAWCSSDAALTHSLRRRLLRGEALRQALQSGRHPTSAELRSWLVGEHEVQLAFPELLANHAPEVGPLLEILSRHLDAVQALLTQHRASARADAMRADTLRTLLADHDGTPVVAFSQFAETVRALGRALSDIAGVGVLTSRRAWIASGPIARDEALAHFAPVAHGRPPPPPHLRIRLLLATDLLAEGVNLQDAGVVVHLDLPWTDALRTQRVGRCVRIGSPHDHVSVYRFELPDGAEAAMRLYRRLRRKAVLGERLVGRTNVGRANVGRVNVGRVNVGRVNVGRANVGRRRRARTPQSAADAASRLRDLMSQWLVNNDVATEGRESESRAPLLATVRASRGGFVALVHNIHKAPQLLCGVLSTAHGRTRLVLSTSPGRILSLLEQTFDEYDETPSQHPTVNWEWVERAVRRWRRRSSRDRDLGRQDAGHSRESSVHLRVRAELRRSLSHLPAMQRSRWRDEYAATEEMLTRVRGASVERELTEWFNQRATMTFAEWIEGWRSFPSLVRDGGSGARAPAPINHQRAGRTTILAVLLLN